MTDSKTSSSIIEESIKPKPKTSIFVKIRPAYPFLVILAIWQLSAMYVGGNLGQLFPTVDKIAIRAYELLTDPLVEALQENKVNGIGDTLHYLTEGPIIWHVFHTAWRLPLAFFIAAIVGAVSYTHLTLPTTPYV